MQDRSAFGNAVRAPHIEPNYCGSDRSIRGFIVAT
jgi:hypothetical protein